MIKLVGSTCLHAIVHTRLSVDVSSLTVFITNINDCIDHYKLDICMYHSVLRLESGDLNWHTFDDFTYHIDYKFQLHYLESLHVCFSFYADFGPLNLAQLYRYCCKLNKKLKVCILHMTVVCISYTVIQIK